MKRRLEIDWKRDTSGSFGVSLQRYKRYLKDIGFRDSTIDSYVGQVGRYLKFAGTDKPPIESAARFRQVLHEKRLSRSSISNYSFSITKYHEMLGEKVSLPFLKRNDELPYYFSEDDVRSIFDTCTNLKHYAMLQTIFYGCLRASELCNIDDQDLDLKTSTLHVRAGKGGRDGIAYISNDCNKTLKKYLEVRPPLEIDGRQPLFYTDYGKRWDRRDVNRMFNYYKKNAGVEKAGGVHVFSRHTAATILVANGCDLRLVKELLRHKDIRTTLRYAHVADKTLRDKYNQCLTIGV
jgi:integrase/recombinase XerD